MMNACSICATSADAATGVLCTSCAAEIAGPERRAPGIVTSLHSPDAAAAWLIDAWGQLHPMPARCRIGRDRDLNDIVIADLLVSAEHAQLSLDNDRWVVRDRGSANGSGVGGDGLRVREAEVAHRARLWFGGVEFYFWAQVEPPTRERLPLKVRTVVPDLAAFSLVKGEHGQLSVHQAPGHQAARAPGELTYTPPAGESARRVVLARLQFQLMRVLCERALSDGDDDIARRGLVSTHELLAALPFHTSRPEPNHVRQVVSTLRASLERAGVPRATSAGTDGVIHATERLGYRLTWEVRRLRAAK